MRGSSVAAGRSGISPSSERSAARLFERQVARRDHDVGSGEVVLGSCSPCERTSSAISSSFASSSASSFRSRPRPTAVVELVELLEQRVVDAVLAASAHQPDDHDSSSFSSRPSRARPSSSPARESTWLCDEICASSRSSCVWSLVKSSRAPDSTSSSIAPARACHRLGLVLRALDRQAGVGHLLADARSPPRRSAPAPRLPSTGP